MIRARPPHDPVDNRLKYDEPIGEGSGGMTSNGGIRWGIIGTANIARGQFLPGLREAGGGHADLVASRDAARAGAWAAEHGVARGAAGYAAVAESPEIDAVYVALPNALHAEWTIRALRAGKAVLCEKPLAVGAAQTREILSAAAALPGALLWEAFVFPFQAQHQRLTALLAGGAIGGLAEIISSFHFRMSQPGNIRLSAALGGGALADVGCYPIRLAHELFGGAALAAAGGSAIMGAEVETDAAGIMTAGTRRLLLTCGFHRGYDTATQVMGAEGTVHLTNPFHPDPADTLTLRRPRADAITEHPTTDAHSFTAALRHIHAVLRGEAAPQHTAASSALPAAQALEAIQSTCRASAVTRPA
jgi:predicted dehydrogenase